MTSAIDPRVREWTEIFKTCILQRGALHVRCPVSSIASSNADMLSLQRRRLETTFAPLIGAAARAIIIGVDGAPGSLGDAKELSGLLDCNGNVCELERAPALVCRHVDFFVDRFRVDAGIGTYKTFYPPYAELICIFHDPINMPLAWIGEIEGMSLWNLGCLKTPLKGLSSQARQVIGGATRKRQVAVTIELGHAATAATLYIPAPDREMLTERVLRLDLETK